MKETEKNTHADVARDMFACITCWHGWGQMVSKMKQTKNKKPQRWTCWPACGSADVNVTRNALVRLGTCLLPCRHADVARDTSATCIRAGMGRETFACTWTC